jgi:hypothetical protein
LTVAVVTPSQISANRHYDLVPYAIPKKQRLLKEMKNKTWAVPSRMQENVQERKGYRSRNENAEIFLRQMQASKLHVCIYGSIYASCFCLARLSSFRGLLKNLGKPPFDGLAAQGACRIVVLSQTERMWIVTFQSSIEDIKTKRGCAEVGCDVIRRLLLVVCHRLRGN